MLCYRNDESISVVTIEDPLKYRVSRVQQTLFPACTDPRYAEPVRSMMRQDADLILVGEM
ncbi:MAG: secretion system protein E, partial [Candidatus Latescibacteria bacterium]|nr:secretion system protein E [Candidatus Latescibacterota bacterium]NIO78761.1 secretion system protein E [Candidatus Latescibacterota bacterium]